jgi:hypothetical protein
VPILTPQLASQRLDAFGWLKYREVQSDRRPREITIAEARLFLRADPGRTYRIRKVAKLLRLTERTVGKVWRRMIAP